MLNKEKLDDLEQRAKAIQDVGHFTSFTIEIKDVLSLVKTARAAFELVETIDGPLDDIDATYKDEEIAEGLEEIRAQVSRLTEALKQ